LAGFRFALQSDVGHQQPEARVTPQQFAGDLVQQCDIARLQRPARRDRFHLCSAAAPPRLHWELIEIDRYRIYGKVGLCLAILQHQCVAIVDQQLDEILKTAAELADALLSSVLVMPSAMSRSVVYRVE
jgi:hypothetical protein